MNLSRRDLLLGAGAAAAGTRLNASARTPQPYFGLHEFIEQNPKAVFIRRTRVASRMDRQGKLREGLALARQIFVPRETPGVPVSHRVVLKPNWTSVFRRGRTVEQDWHTGTDPQFYEGMVMGLQELGVRKMTFVEANARETWNIRGFVDINDRLGVEMNETERSLRQLREGDGITWSRVPEPVIFTRIPHYAPVNEPHTWLLNIAKWKTHTMCLTLAAKNLQGLTVLPYTQFCTGLRGVAGVPDSMKPDIRPDAEQVVERLCREHARTYSRYHSPELRGDRGADGPLRQEIWAHKTCDNLSVLRDGLSMIEGIVAMGNTAFDGGDEFLTNLVMFGKHKFRLDLVALYLAGHEPGNVHLYRIAKQRGLSDTFNPWDVSIFEWTDRGPVPRKLTDFERTPLKTLYLPLPGEPKFHLVDEPFDYDRYRA